MRLELTSLFCLREIWFSIFLHMCAVIVLLIRKYVSTTVIVVEMESATRVQILDVGVCIFLCVHALLKDMNSSVIIPAKKKLLSFQLRENWYPSS